MHGNISINDAGAIPAAPGTGIAPVPDPGVNPGTGTGTDDDNWFYDTAIAVFGAKETGLHLHLATGWPRTSCYAFVARDPEQRRKPSPEFLRILFRSAHGAPFHDAFMHGSNAQWWRDLQRAKRIAAQVDKLDLT